jgi:hypothetical protein
VLAPFHACSEVAPLPEPGMVAVAARGLCSFAEKVGKGGHTPAQTRCATALCACVSSHARAYVAGVCLARREKVMCGAVRVCVFTVCPASHRALRTCHSRCALSLWCALCAQVAFAQAAGASALVIVDLEDVEVVGPLNPNLFSMADGGVGKSVNIPSLLVQVRLCSATV